MTDVNRYKFSFTAASLRLNEMIYTARNLDFLKDDELIKELGAGKSSTGRRMFIELKNRINKLTPSQRKLLAEGDLIIQKQIAFLAICKSYSFIRDFAIEVLREKVLLFDYQLTEGEYLTFFRQKSENHVEMENLSDLSRYKVKQVTFKILEQAGIIDNIKYKNIQPQLLDDSCVRAIINDNKELLKLFFWSDLDIKNI